MKRLPAIAFVLIALSACATPYIERSPTAASIFGGVSIEKIRPDTYRVYALGNVATTHLQVREYVLRRAAKQAHEDGFDGFRVEAGTDLTRTEFASVGFATVQGGTAVGFGIPTASTYPSIELIVRMTNEAEPPDGYFRASDYEQ